jgi:hypothetical protein
VIVTVNVAPAPAVPRIEVQEPGDFKRLHVSVGAGVGSESFASLLNAVQSPLSARDTTHVEIDESWLRGQIAAEHSGTPAGYEDMLAYAATKGWYDAARGTITAHVVHED